MASGPQPPESPTDRIEGSTCLGCPASLLTGSTVGAEDSARGSRQRSPESRGRGPRGYAPEGSLRRTKRSRGRRRHGWRRRAFVDCHRRSVATALGEATAAGASPRASQVGSPVARAVAFARLPAPGRCLRAWAAASSRPRRFRSRRHCHVDWSCVLGG
jgi:hypothetical protein